MGSVKSFAIAGSVALAASAVMAAQPSIFAAVQPGLWEISGTPGSKAPVRQCVAQVSSLAKFEHRGKICAPKIISSNGSSAVIEYSCGAAGFGHSEVDVLTPRSLRINTQGISNQLPFSYVLQARRVGDCPAPASPTRH